MADVEQILEARRHDLGAFEVGRALPQIARRSVGPFVFFDHFGPTAFAKGAGREVDVRPHPHIGLATVTYLIEGAITHRDSVGSELEILPGEVNWMTAGRGITHSERFERLRAQGGPLHGLQAWVALPKEDEEMAPAFSHHAGADLPTYEAPGLWARLIAGEGFGTRSPAPTRSPMIYVHWRLSAGAKAQIPADFPERALFVASGAVEIGGTPLASGQMALLTPGSPVVVSGLQDANLMILGGEPLGPRYVEWNFVSSSRERIAQAKADWRAGRMKLPDLDDQEFIPLPDEPGRGAHAPSTESR
jgi:redox-sensitive bicupin YhaK (pirin superfamily)